MSEAKSQEAGLAPPSGPAQPGGAFEAEVLSEIPNLGGAKGAPFLLLRAPDGAFALAQKVGDQFNVVSEWASEQRVLDGAVRVLGQDPAALTSPKALQHLALALVGIFAAAERRKAEKGGAA
ncbi:MAG: hypothetical protein ACR650_09705 [Methylocystis sp.]